MGKAEYCHVNVRREGVSGDDRKKRGWSKDGTAWFASNTIASGTDVKELAAAEGGSRAIYPNPSPAASRGMLALLNSLAEDGWRIVNFFPRMQSSGESTGWPWGIFLLFREAA